MMTVRVLVSIAGVSFSYAPDDVVELEKAEAQRWIAAGIAEAVQRDAAPEAAVAKPRETTTKSRAKPRGV